MVGRSILFDTRLSYLDAGNSNMRQVTTELYLYKGDQCHGTRYAVCSNATGTCVATTAFQDRLTFSIGSHLFDLNITLNSTTLDDMGEYIMCVDVRNYETGGLDHITKTFTASKL